MNQMDGSRIVGLLVIELPIIVLAFLNLLPEQPMVSGYTTLIALNVIFFIVMPLSTWFFGIKKFGLVSRSLARRGGYKY